MDQIVNQNNATTYSEDEVYYVRNEPVMDCAIDALTRLGKTNKIILKAKGNAIPNAVAIANIITEKFLKGNSRIDKVTVDSDAIENMGRLVSLIEIILVKTN